MSLLLNASPWTSTETSKKRISTIKKSFKSTFLEDESNNENNKDINNSTTSTSQTPSSKPTPTGSVNLDSINQSSIGTSLYDNGQSQSLNTREGFNNLDTSINEYVKSQENKTNKINQLLDNMAIQNDGDSLYNYSAPSLNSSIDDVTKTPSIPIFQRNGIIGQGVVNNGNEQRRSTGRGGGGSSNFVYNTPDILANLENYSKAYEIPRETRPYYTNKLGISNNNDSFEEKILDKIQYLTHLMEEIQNEKTSNITEEFILYTMLGVFVIYVVDAFSKSGKYIR